MKYRVKPRYRLFALALLTTLGVAAQNSIQKSMLDSFVKYVSINSQSDYDSICTEGQHSIREYADLQEMEECYRLMLEIIKQVPSLKQ